MNTQIINEFTELINNLLYTKPSNYTFKINSFKKTIEIIKNLDYNITNVNQLKDIKGIGKGTLDRINEILNNGKLNENKKIVDDFKELQTITGIGPSKAKQLIEKNFIFNDVINNEPKVVEHLTHHQLIGIKYYYDILKPIQRNIIEDVEKYLTKFNFKFNICGSYRRKKNTSGDIDILIEENNIKLKSIIDLLVKDKFLLDHLTVCGNTKYMGICKIKNSQCMRIDIRLVPKISYVYALLYFTGSKKIIH